MISNTLPVTGCVEDVRVGSKPFPIWVDDSSRAEFRSERYASLMHNRDNANQMTFLDVCQRGTSSRLTVVNFSHLLQRRTCPCGGTLGSYNPALWECSRVRCKTKVTKQLLDHVQRNIPPIPSVSPEPVRKKQKTAQNKGHWDAREHEAYLNGMRKYGRNWSKVASVVKTRIPAQVRTHDQKMRAKKARSSDVYAANILCAMRVGARMFEPVTSVSSHSTATTHVA